MPGPPQQQPGGGAEAGAVRKHSPAGVVRDIREQLAAHLTEVQSDTTGERLRHLLGELYSHQKNCHTLLILLARRE